MTACAVGVYRGTGSITQSDPWYINALKFSLITIIHLIQVNMLNDTDASPLVKLIVSCYLFEITDCSSCFYTELEQALKAGLYFRVAPTSSLPTPSQTARHAILHQYNKGNESTHRTTTAFIDYLAI